MALETPISYPMTLRYDEGPRRVEVRGRMDYCLWYGKPCEAETVGYIAGGPCLSALEAGPHLHRWLNGRKMNFWHLGWPPALLGTRGYGCHIEVGGQSGCWY
jgi:hypothetical protein